MAKRKNTTLSLQEAARKAALQTKTGGKITGEQIRLRAETMGATASSPAAWGGIIQGLANAGLLTKTGETVRMESPQARGRRSPVYLRNSSVGLFTS